jgi:cytochrome c oxidase subunit 1
MATTTVDGVHGDAHGHETSYLDASKGIMNWLITIDHKRIGMMYLASVWLFFCIAGVLALLFRIELLTPNLDFLLGLVGGENVRQVHANALDLYNQVFTLHGAIMVFASSSRPSRARSATSSCPSCWAPRTWRSPS